MTISKKERGFLSDEEIIALFWERDEMAIAETDAKYRRYLFSVAYNILADSEDCEECLNDTYLGAWDAIPPERPRVLRAFLTVIMRRCALNRYNFRSAAKRVPSSMTSSLEELEGVLFDEERTDEAQALGAIIEAYIRSLSKRRRYVFMSRYYVSKPIDRIAEELGVSRSTVNKDIEAIKSGLIVCLGNAGYKI